MKKFLIIVGSLALGLVVLIAVGIAIAAVRGNALDRGSLEYVEAVVPTICSQWDEQALLDRASPELKQVIKADEMNRLFRWFKMLGPLQHTDTPQGQSLASFTSASGTQVSAKYTVKARFEKGDGTITIGLIKHGDQWQILGFNVQSLQLAPP